MYYDTPVNPGAMTPRQMLTATARHLASLACIATLTTIILFAIVALS